MFSKHSRRLSWIHSEWIADGTQPGISCQWLSQSVLDGQRQINYYDSRNRKKKCFNQERNTWQQLLPETVKASHRWRFASAVKRAVTSEAIWRKNIPSPHLWRHATWVKAIRTLKCHEWHCAVDEWVEEFCKPKDKSLVELGSISREGQT